MPDDRSDDRLIVALDVPNIVQGLALAGRPGPRRCRSTRSAWGCWQPSAAALLANEAEARAWQADFST